jgi:hypothetical protein
MTSVIVYIIMRQFYFSIYNVAKPSLFKDLLSWQYKIETVGYCAPCML